MYRLVSRIPDGLAKLFIDIPKKAEKKRNQRRRPRSVPKN
jgi:hypothetical protein